MKYAAFTSMDKEYFDHCGESMIKSYIQHWSDKIPLFLYNEDFHYKSKYVKQMGWDLGRQYDKFQARHSNSKVKTFAKKGFSIIDAMNNIDCEKLIWLDADTICKRGIHTQMIDLICPDDVLSAHYGVNHAWPSEKDPDRKMFSCETGFFVLNKKHRLFTEFKKIYSEIYIQDKQENLRRFYDGEVYGETIRLLQKRGAKTNDLNPGGHKTPIPRSVMSVYIQHYKAGLKDNIDNEKLAQRHEISDEEDS